MPSRNLVSFQKHVMLSKRFLSFLALMSLLASCVSNAPITRQTIPSAKPQAPAVSVVPTSQPTAIPSATVSITPEPSPTPLSLPIKVPVLILSYYPTDPNKPRYLDSAETDLSNYSVSDMQKHVQVMIDEGQRLSSDATHYHGYKDPSAPVYLSYYTFKQLEYFYAMPRGYHLEGTAYRPNYGQILRDLDICSYIDLNGIKEVWIYGYHSSFIVPDESKVSSKYGDVSNAFPRDEEIPEEYRLPRCNNSYVMYNFNYSREVDTTLHNRMHQIENVIFFAENHGYPANDTNVVGSLFWDDFSVYGNRATLSSYHASCGNTHSPPNTTEGYIYNSTQYRENNCETWNPHDSQTTYVSANCSQWGCTEIGFYKWYMQNVPGYNNGIVYNGQQMRNWWEAMYDFNAFIDAGRSLYEPPSNVYVTPSPVPPNVYLSPSPVPTDNAQLVKPVFVYPNDGATLDYNGYYLFKVETIPNAQGFLWGFFQNGVMVWENLRDEGTISGNEYGIHPNTIAHSKFVTGGVEVWVRASINGQWTDATMITIYLR